ncbi:MAG: Uncharacterized protein CEN89_41 [Candidatus Berkelbacteria bacterium Licking1014_7]|uniref:Nucleotidyl transferase AbiEii toxin, Type IV TA system n=1 Tax=Candidatus Berkelbacteria bacterium Licking1014_7 TaxID=2017147 RepID=A0A554LL08_9BACT|nr:MAG: Uncharacterized protein CEN89_41 [Candidatus Berkelbacteria bacterium Licking1014_7]
MLTKPQKLALKIIFDSNLAKISAWGGGTALSEVYLHHRRSSDIDIILSQMPPLSDLTLLVKQIKSALRAGKVISYSKMNRFQYVFISAKTQLKLEFVFYPFVKLSRIKRWGNVRVESLFDMAASKTLASYQRHEPKDTVDMYFLLKDKFPLAKLVKGVEKKFGETIDAAHLLAKLTDNLEKCLAIKPLLYKKFDKKTVEKFFQQEFNQLKF